MKHETMSALALQFGLMDDICTDGKPFYGRGKRLIMSQPVNLKDPSYQPKPPKRKRKTKGERR